MRLSCASCNCLDAAALLANRFTRAVPFLSRTNPFPSARWDPIWSPNPFDTFAIPRQCAEAYHLRPGLLIANVDLADHAVYRSSDRQHLFDCLRYPA